MLDQVFNTTRKSAAMCLKAMVTLTEEYLVNLIEAKPKKFNAKVSKRKSQIQSKFQYKRIHPTIRAEVAKMTASFS